MRDKALIKFAFEFREGILDGGSPWLMCAAVCWPLTTLLRMHGVENETVTTDLGGINHIWLRLADGRALDPTADQFNGLTGETFPAVYLGPPKAIHTGTAISYEALYERELAHRSAALTKQPVDSLPGTEGVG